MEEIDLYLEKIRNNVLESKDIDLIIKMIEEDTKKGHIKSEKDDIQWFEVYKFGLEELELALKGGSNMKVGDWRQNLDYSKVRSFVDEMEEKSLITNVSWHGAVIFDIVNPEVYRIHLCNKIKEHICKLYGL
ncbi:hypothetical protein [Methanohalophilus sp.]|uniref:hypothetical protein n=1 Tax=Methanohalophilus sp. TaxID=1966352 RepID=UPI0026179119|nr:hypothetical protein [Methanohalophilus sp.]MDK2891823.1 hypothetical protein [Methanohalophilus sp.]